MKDINRGRKCLILFRAPVSLEALVKTDRKTGSDPRRACIALRLYEAAQVQSNAHPSVSSVDLPPAARLSTERRRRGGAI